MDKHQLIDQIGAIDLQISQLKEQMRPVRDEPVEGDRMKHERIRQEVQQLVDRKAGLRVELAKAKSHLLIAASSTSQYCFGLSRYQTSRIQ